MSDYKITIELLGSKKNHSNGECKYVTPPFKKNIENNDCVNFNDESIDVAFSSIQFSYFKGNTNGKLYFSFGCMDQEDRYLMLKDLGCKSDLSKNDAEIMLKFYITFGETGFKKLNNGFLLIIYDYVKNEVIGIRDHIGFNNFFYFFSKSFDSITISGNFSALLSARNSSSIDSEKLNNFLQLSDTCQESTFIKEIKKLPPACSLYFSKFRIKIKNYFSYKKITNQANDEVYLVEKMRQNMIDATLSYSSSKQDRVGFLFSGGLDSSSLISIFHKYSNKKLFAYTAKFSNFSSDTAHLIKEDNFQDEILNGTEIKKRGFSAERLTTLSNIDFYLGIIGQPFFFPNLYIPAESFQRAAEDGIKVVVNGNDGDSVVSHGYELLVELFISFKWFRLFKEISAISKLRQKSKRFIFVNAVLKQLKFNKIFFTTAYNRHKEIISSPIHTNALEVQSTLAAYYDIKEVYPFYKKSLINFCLNVPSDLKIKDGYSRYLLRSAMKGIVPDKVRLRTTKSNLAHSLVLNFCNEDRKLIEESLRNPHHNIIQFIDLENLKKQWKNLLSDPKKFATRSDIPSKLFAFVVANRWLFSMKVKHEEK